MLEATSILWRQPARRISEGQVVMISLFFVMREFSDKSYHRELCDERVIIDLSLLGSL